MAWYTTGTVTVTNGSATVSGSSTLWASVGILNPGDIFYGPDGKQYQTLSIQSNTGLTLASNYLGSSASAQPYSIIPIGLLPSTLAQQVAAVLATANTSLASAVLFTSGQSLTATQQGYACANIGALQASNVGYGYTSISVAGNTNVTLTSSQAANQFITLTGALTGNIQVIVPSSPRLYFINNQTTGAYSVTIITASGTGLVATQGYYTGLGCDGTNVINPMVLDVGAHAITGALTVTVGGAAITGNSTFAGTQTITSASASSFAVGLNGATNPAFSVNSSTASQAAGLSVIGAVTGGTVAITATDSGSNTNISINAKGSGTLALNNTATGAVSIGGNSMAAGSGLTYNAGVGGAGLSINAYSAAGTTLLALNDTNNIIGAGSYFINAQSTGGSQKFSVHGDGSMYVLGLASFAAGISVTGQTTTNSIATNEVTISASTYSVLSTDHTVIQTTAASTYTLPAASLNAGRELHIVTQYAGAVISASANVVPLAGGTAGTAILAATAGKWATLKSNGTNWVIIASN